LIGFYYFRNRYPWQVGLSIRLSVLPITIKNYSAAALPFAALPFAVTAFLGDLPYMIIYASIGTSVAHISDIVSGKSPAAIAGIILGVTFVVVSVLLGKYLFARLENEQQQEQQEQQELAIREGAVIELLPGEQPIAGASPPAKD
jgi:uncharacterized membrane protein YdjX (TVP38/TMEM64 family)